MHYYKQKNHLEKAVFNRSLYWLPDFKRFHVTAASLLEINCINVWWLNQRKNMCQALEMKEELGFLSVGGSWDRSVRLFCVLIQVTCWVCTHTGGRWGGGGGVYRVWVSGWAWGQGIDRTKGQISAAVWPQLKIIRMCRVLKCATLRQVNRTHKSWERSKMQF